MIIGTIKADKEAALKSETPSSISETGAYTGTFLQAEQFDTKNGATMLQFYFKSDSGSTAWLSLCIIKTNGDESFGMGIFQSIMACANVPAVDWVEGKVRKMNGEIGKGYRGKAIEGVRIGLLLESEPYEKVTANGVRIYSEMRIRRAFNATTGLTCKEADEKAEAPTAIANMLKNLKEHPKPVRKANGSSAAPSSAPDMPPEPDLDDMPF